jgi:ArsR family transcriptional regulator, arsenate/arsenite/antimonite-responsive transcriptional repressor
MAIALARIRTCSRPRSVELFHALSDETRLQILDLLRDGERCVCDLQFDVGAAQSRLSFHLRVLRDAGLVTDRKEGRWSYYALAADTLAEVHDHVVSLRSATALGTAKLPVVGRCCG